jgi:hypothetical protein
MLMCRDAELHRQNLDFWFKQASLAFEKAQAAFAVKDEDAFQRWRAEHRFCGRRLNAELEGKWEAK